jgi:hypothetical protein
MVDDPVGKGFWPDWMTPRRAWEFIKNVATLEQSVDALKADNRQIRLELAKAQQQLLEQNAQLALLSTFVRESLSNRLDAKIERLSAELIAEKSKKT